MMKMKITYANGPDMFDVEGEMIPVSGPFHDFFVVKTEEGYTAIAPNRIIRMDIDEIPDFFKVSVDHIAMSKEMSLTMMEEDFRQMSTKGGLDSGFQ